MPDNQPTGKKRCSYKSFDWQCPFDAHHPHPAPLQRTGEGARRPDEDSGSLSTGGEGGGEDSGSLSTGGEGGGEDSGSLSIGGEGGGEDRPLCIFHLPADQKRPTDFWRHLASYISALLDKAGTNQTAEWAKENQDHWVFREADPELIRTYASVISSEVEKSLSWRFTGFIFPAMDETHNFADFGFPAADFRDAEFSGAASFSGATFGGAANFGGATFSGKASFWGATFSGEANFGGATFSGEANFGGATFSGAASFRGATFSGEANFQNATFCREAVFKAADFHGTADFLKAKFGGRNKSPANFSDAHFSGGTAFSAAEFSGEANFWGATFSGEANFGGATFSGEAYFSGAVFVGEASFVEAKFGGEDKAPAVFTDATFSGPADFSDARFSGAAQFWRATFSGVADFSSAAFSGVADFWAAAFSEPAYLTRAEVKKLMDFTGASVRNRLLFAGTKFGADARILLWGLDFVHGTSDISLDEGRLDGEVAEKKLSLAERPRTGKIVEPAGQVVFRDISEGMNRVSFLHTDILTDRLLVRFSNVKWETDPKAFIFDARFAFIPHREWNKEGVAAKTGLPEERIDQLPELFFAEELAGCEELVKQDVERIAREIRRSTEEYGSYSDAGDFHVAEMEYRRKQAPRLSFRRALLTGYKCFSLYGESSGRAFAWFIGVWLFFAQVYMHTGFSFGTAGATRYLLKPELQFTWGTFSQNFADFVHALGFSFVSLIPGYFRSSTPQSLVGPVTPFAMVAESVLGITLLTLFLLAIRRRFRR